MALRPRGGALRGQPGFREDHLLVLAEAAGPGVGCASREGVRRAVRELVARMDEESVLFVVLLGHGTYDGDEAKFNLVGPDLAASEWAELVAAAPGRLVFVNTTAASAPFIAALAQPGRIVITATESPVQRYATVFPEFMIRAFVDAASDLDRNGRVSVWEAFAYASAGVRRWYQERGRLATERAILDDTGDGQGIEAATARRGRTPAWRRRCMRGPAWAPSRRARAAKRTGWRRGAPRSRPRWPSCGRHAPPWRRSATPPNWNGCWWNWRGSRAKCGA